MKIHKMNRYCLLLLACMLCSCATKQNFTQSELGEWNFAYIQKGPFMFGGFPPPPQFDTYLFKSPGKITIKSSLEALEFDGKYRISGNNLDYDFHPTDVEKPIEHNLKYSLKDNGATLQLTLDNSEFVYYRPERFYPYSISGEYIVEKNGKSLTMKLGSNGEYHLKEINVIGHYRLWPSRFGKTMSATVFIPDHGGYFMIWRYEVVNNDLVLTQISPNGLLENTATTWKHM